MKMQVGDHFRINRNSHSHYIGAEGIVTAITKSDWSGEGVYVVEYTYKPVAGASYQTSIACLSERIFDVIESGPESYEEFFF